MAHGEGVACIPQFTLGSRQQARVRYWAKASLVIRSWAFRFRKGPAKLGRLVKYPIGKN